MKLPHSLTSEQRAAIEHVLEIARRIHATDLAAIEELKELLGDNYEQMEGSFMHTCDLGVALQQMDAALGALGTSSESRAVQSWSSRQSESRIVVVQRKAEA